MTAQPAGGGPGVGHTPGPWSLPHFAAPEANCECKYVLCDHLMGAVASVHCSGEGGDWEKHGDNPRYAEAVANAHLIAAAPDLLAACRTVLIFFKGGMWTPELAADWKALTGSDEATTLNLCNGVRAAIAKATGSAP